MQNELAALVGSRICHDLISPVGAISNGVELLSLTDGDTTAEMKLISESVESASARIRFFRIAFGAASPDQYIGRSEILGVLSGAALGGRFSYLWQIADDQRRLDVRLALLLMQCFESALPLGGDITVEAHGNAWRMNASGSRIAADPMLWDAISDPDSTVKHTPAQVHFALIPSALADAERDLAIDIQSDRITAKF